MCNVGIEACGGSRPDTIDWVRKLDARAMSVDVWAGVNGVRFAAIERTETRLSRVDDFRHPSRRRREGHAGLFPETSTEAVARSPLAQGATEGSQ